MVGVPFLVIKKNFPRIVNCIVFLLTFEVSNKQKTTIMKTIKAPKQTLTITRSNGKQLTINLLNVIAKNKKTNEKVMFEFE